ncbi:unnamed protein product [Leuciscus chuanchicus]
MRDIKDQADKVSPNSDNLMCSNNKAKALWAFLKNIVKPGSIYKELEKELGAVLENTLQGLEELDVFMDAVENLAVTSPFVFTGQSFLSEDESPESHPGEGIELVQCSTAGTKTALFFLNPRFYYRPYSPLQYPGIDFPGEAEKCDPPVVGTHPPIPLLKKWDHHPGLPVQRYCPRPPRDVADACQPRQPHNIQRLEVLRVDLIHPRCLATEELLNYLCDFSLGEGRRVGGIEEILEVFLPPSDDIPSRAWRASFRVQGSGRQGLRLPPDPLSTGPLQSLLLVVSPQEGGPTSLLQAEPGRTPWGEARPPGALIRSPTPGLAPGWGPGCVMPGDVTVLDLISIIKGF